MSFATWLPEVLRAEGLKVEELPGWQTRSTWQSGFTPLAVIVHHTGPWSLPGILGVLKNGRSDLRGPLCQLGLGPDGTVYVIAAGRGNHNGFGTFGNDAIGMEMFNNGTTEPWPQAQWDAAVKVVAALVRHTGLPVSRVLGHKESDPGRKPDPSRWDMAAFRAAVSRRLAGHPDEEDDMPTPAELKVAITDPIVAAITANTTRAIQDQATRLYRINSTLKAILAAELADDAKLDEIVAAIEADVAEQSGVAPDADA